MGELLFCVGGTILFSAIGKPQLFVAEKLPFSAVGVLLFAVEAPFCFGKGALLRPDKEETLSSGRPLPFATPQRMRTIF